MTQADQLLARVARLETELAAASMEIERLRGASRRRRLVYGAIATLAVIGASSLVPSAQTPSRIPGTPEEQYFSLVKRVTALEQRSNSKLKAPFEVTDEAGKTIFRVTTAPRGFALLDQGGTELAVGRALDAGGFFKALAPDASTSVSMGVAGKSFTGIVTRYAGDQPRASLGVTAGGGFVDLATASGSVIAHLGESSSGNGFFQLAESGGTALVEAGIGPGGFGVVRTFPNGNTATGLVGLPGTFIVGRKQ